MITIKARNTENIIGPEPTAAKFLSGSPVQDQLTQRVLEYFYGQICDGSMKTEELQARLADQVRFGQLIDSQGRELQDDLGRSIVPTSDQRDWAKNIATLDIAPILSQAVASRELAVKESSAATTVVAALQYFTNALIDKGMTENEFQARLADQVRFGQLIDSQGRKLQDDLGRSIVPTSDQRDWAKKITELNLTKSFEDLKSCLTNYDNPAAANAIRDYLQRDQILTGDPAEQFMMGMVGRSESGRLLELANTIRNTLARKEREAAFFEQFAKSTDFPELAAVVDQFPLVTNEDRQLRITCLTRIANKRLLNTLNSGITAIAEGKTYEEVVGIVRPLTTSKSEADQKAGLQVIETFCRAEIANITADAVKIISPKLTQPAIDAALARLPFRAAVGKVDYADAANKLKAFFEPQLLLASQLQRLQEVNRIRESARPGAYGKALADLKALDFGLADDVAAKGPVLRELQVASFADSRPEYDQLFSAEVIFASKRSTAGLFPVRDLGRNTPSIQYLAGQFRDVLNPLLQTLRQAPETRAGIESYLGSDPIDDQGERIPRGLKSRFELNLEKLAAQRPLAESELAYLTSVKSLTRLNPALVAMMETAPDEVFEYLRAHFERESEKTWAELKDGDYVPSALVGFGAHGIAAMGEVARVNPELAAQMLVIDQEELPGGPFSIPRGPAWELNSANARGNGLAKLPDASSVPIEKTVRGFGSPLRWFPGERSAANGDSRGGSINQVVDYFPAPDAISDFRYPTNSEFALIAQTQAALVAKRTLMRTALVGFEQNTDATKRGDKVLTLQRTNPDGTVESKRIFTDGFIGAAGLGEGNLGFDVASSRGRLVIEAKTPSGEFPMVSTTMGAFRALADRTAPKIKRIGDTIVIWGSGNSADTLLENIGNLFAQSNPIVRNITKVYVIAEGDFSARPRYAKILDLQSRNGRGNLVEVIQDRVTDVGPSPTSSKKILVYGRDGTPIKDKAGKPIEPYHAISAAGFRPTIKGIITGKDVRGGQATREAAEAAFEPIVLPTTNDIFVGEALKDDPNTILVGTGSKPSFDKAKKLQLPASAANALSRVGGENAVAIGFRVPETQAAINEWLYRREFTLSPIPLPRPRPISVFASDAQSGRTDSVTIPMAQTGQTNTSEAITNPGRLASALLGQLLERQGILFERSPEKAISGTTQFRIQRLPEGLKITYNSQNGPPLTTEFLAVLKDVFADRFLMAYVTKAIEQKRRAPELTMDIDFWNGDISLKNTFIE